MAKVKKVKGFTLIELLVVIAIIGLLSAIAIYSLMLVRVKGRDTQRIADLKQVHKALELFYDKYGQYPPVDGSGTWQQIWGRLQSCLQSGTNCNMTVSNFKTDMSKVPQDPLGNSYTYYYWHCNSGKSIRLRAVLENVNHSALKDDVDGNFFNSDGGCNDAAGNYCIGINSWCW